MFFIYRAIFIFIPLGVPWGSNLDPCGKNVILTGARKIHIKVVYGFYPSDISQFHSFSCPFGSQLGSLLQKCNPERCSRISHQSRLCFFTHQTFSIFIPLAVPWCPNLVSLLQQCDPDRCAQNSHQSRLCFLTHQTFSIFIPLFVPCRPNLDPCGKNVVLTGARQIRIKVVCDFLPIRHFLFSFLWSSLGSQFGSLQQKRDPDRRAQNSH